MKYLKLVTSDIDVRPFLDEIGAHSDLWYVDTSRQERISKQRETLAIALRSHGDTAVLDSRLRRAKPLGYRGRPTPMASHFPFASAYVDQLVRTMDGAMGRAVMTNLKPHGRIYPHADDGLYWLLRDRYHLVLKSATGSHFKVGGEEVRMQAGELWWFDPTVTHEAFNDSDEDRIHIILDVLSAHSMRSFRRRLVRLPVRSLCAFYNAGIRGVLWSLRQRLSSPSAKGLAAR